METAVLEETHGEYIQCISPQANQPYLPLEFLEQRNLRRCYAMQARRRRILLLQLLNTHQTQQRHATVCPREILTLDSLMPQSSIQIDQFPVCILQLSFLFH